MLIFLIKKKLPWDFYSKIFDRVKYINALKIKETNDNGKLFSDLPMELTEYINYTRNLKFEECPNYSYLRSLFKKIITKNNMDYKRLTFSWIYFDNRILLGIPINPSLRKNKSHMRIMDGFEEKNKSRLQSEESEHNIRKKNNSSNKSIYNNLYSINHISYNFISESLSAKKTNDKNNNRCNLITNKYWSDNNTINKDENHNNIKMKYLRTNNNNNKNIIKKLNNNNNNKPFLYNNNTGIRSEVNKKYFYNNINKSNRNNFIDYSDSFINKNNRIIVPKNAITTINNSNSDIFQTNNKNQKNIKFKFNQIVKHSSPSPYNINNIYKNNNFFKSSNSSSKSNIISNYIMTPKTQKIEIHKNLINRVQKRNFNKQFPNIISFNKYNTKIINHKSPSHKHLKQNRNLNPNEYRSILTNNCSIINNNIYNSSSQTNINKRQLLKKILLPNPIQINI